MQNEIKQFAVPARSAPFRGPAMLCALLVLASAAPVAAQAPTAEQVTLASAPGARLYNPSAAFTGDGSALVLWEHSAAGIAARRVGAGTGLARARVLVANDLPSVLPYEGPATLHRDPVVVPLPDGSFLAIWTEERQHVRADILFHDSRAVASTIQVQRFDRVGRPLGEPTAVSGGGLGFEVGPRAVRLGSGRILVVWRTDQDGVSTGIFGRTLGGRGVPLGNAFRIDDRVDEAARRPALAPLPDGGFLVAWQTCCDAGGAPDVAARRFDRYATPLGGAFELLRETAGEQHWPALAVNEDGELMAAWMGPGEGPEGSDYRIYGQRLAADGTPYGPEKALSGGRGLAHGAPALAPLPDGFALIWTLWRSHSVDEVYGVALDPDGVPRARGVELSTGPVGFQWELALTTDASGCVLVAWRGSDAQGHSSINAWTLAPSGRDCGSPPP